MRITMWFLMKKGRKRVMKLKQVIVTALVLGLLVVCASTVRAIDGIFPHWCKPHGRQTTVQTLVHVTERSHLVGHPGRWHDGYLVL